MTQQKQFTILAITIGGYNDEASPSLHTATIVDKGEAKYDIANTPHMMPGYGLGSDLHTWGQVLCQSIERGHRLQVHAERDLHLIQQIKSLQPPKQATLDTSANAAQPIFIFFRSYWKMKLSERTTVKRKENTQNRYFGQRFILKSWF